MKKVKELQENGFYAIQINASASSALVEKVNHAKKFIKLVDNRLVGFAVVYDFLITVDCIFLILKIESQRKVLENYQDQRERSNKANRELDYEEVWRIISEQFRQLISIYVKWFNKDTGRSGSMVARNYERFYFEDSYEASTYIMNLKNEKLRKSQKKKKYRVGKRLCGLKRRMKKGMIYLCSLNKHLLVFRDFLGRRSVNFYDLPEVVLRKMVNSTFTKHAHLISPKRIKIPPSL